jgi:hypothetical protein
LIRRSRGKQQDTNELLSLKNRDTQLGARRQSLQRSELRLWDDQFVNHAAVTARHRLSHQALRWVEDLHVSDSHRAVRREIAELTVHELGSHLALRAMDAVENPVHVRPARVLHQYADTVVVDDALGQAGNRRGNIVEIVERLELRQCGIHRCEPALATLLGQRVLAFFLGERLMSECQRDVVADPGREYGILFVVRFRALRHEGHAPHGPVLHADWNTHARADPVFRHEFDPAPPWLDDGPDRRRSAWREAHTCRLFVDLLDVVDDQEAPVLVVGIFRNRVGIIRQLDHASVGRCLYAHAVALGVDERERHDLVREHLFDHR